MEDVKRHIIETAEEQFRLYGTKSVSVEDICDTLKISKKTLYQHFRSKKQLLTETIEFIFNSHFEKMNRILEKEISALEKFVLIYRYGIQQMVTYDPAFFHEMKKYHHEAHSQYEKKRKEIVFSNVKGLLEEAQNDGEIRPEVNLTLFCELYLSKMDTILASGDLKEKYPKKDLLNHLIIYNLRGIATHPNKISIP